MTDTILVVDAMTGQDAVNAASAFDEAVDVDGVILTKLDGDTRGGAALSIRAVTGKPILYSGIGERLEDLEQFYPDRMASRILGMGDVLSLIDKVSQNVSEEDADRLGKKMMKGQFDYNDYLAQMQQMKNMGGLSSILSMLPGMNIGGLNTKGLKNADMEAGEKQLGKIEAMIYSMTPYERSHPDAVNIQRKRRIAAGAGLSLDEVNRIVKQFEQSRKMMKQMTGMFGRKGSRFKLPF